MFMVSEKTESPVDFHSAIVFCPSSMDPQVATSHRPLGAPPRINSVCRFWMRGKCNRNPCRFMHGELPRANVYRRSSAALNGGIEAKSAQKRLNHDSEHQPRKPPNPSNSSASTTAGGGSGSENKRTNDNSSSGDASEVKTSSKKVCEYWMSGNCPKGDGCESVHSLSFGDWFSLLANLKGHTEAISGVALPSGSDKLYSGSHDGTVRVWDCHTGQSTRVINVGDKVGSLTCEGSWIFVGLPNLVKAWNTETASEYNLNGPVGQVYALAVATDILFAGAQDGAISAWKASTENSNLFGPATSLKGHTGAVTCLTIGRMRLYSGSTDNTIRAWDITTLECIQTLSGHTDDVMSLICWDDYLLSCSLDQTIKAWGTSENGNIEVTYTHDEEHGAIAFCGIKDMEAKPVLLCSCNDNSVYLYDLPSFKERGRIFSKREVGTIETGPDGIFFTGDGAGMLNVWKLAASQV